MSQVPRQVLSYATPKVSRRRVRKPLRTEIVTDKDLPYVQFVEVSAEEEVHAFPAIIFTSLTVLLIGGMAFSAWHRYVARGGHDGRLTQAMVLTTFFLLQIGVILYVVQAVWKRTIVSVRDGSLWVEVTSTFGSSVRRWEADDVDGVEVWTTDEGDRELEPLGEVHVRPRQGATVKLMRNYPRGELVPVVLALEAALRPAARRAKTIIP